MGGTKGGKRKIDSGNGIPSGNERADGNRRTPRPRALLEYCSVDVFNVKGLPWQLVDFFPPISRTFKTDSFVGEEPEEERS